MFTGAGWYVDFSSTALPIYSYFGNTTSWSWKGKGFVCAGYSEDDPNALKIIEALAIAGYPPIQKPVEAGTGSGNSMTLLIGTRAGYDPDE